MFAYEDDEYLMVKAHFTVCYSASLLCTIVLLLFWILAPYSLNNAKIVSFTDLVREVAQFETVNNSTICLKMLDRQTKTVRGHSKITHRSKGSKIWL